MSPWGEEGGFRMPDVSTGKAVRIHRGRWHVVLGDGFTFQREFVSRRRARRWIAEMSGMVALASEDRAAAIAAVHRRSKDAAAARYARRLHTA